MTLVPVAVVLHQFEDCPLVFYVLLQGLVYLALAFCRHRSQIARDGAVGQLLTWRPLAWVGSFSYSLHLSQQPFLAPAGHGVLRSVPIVVILSVLFAWLSLHLIERPFLRLRDRWFASRGAADSVAPPIPVGAGEVL